MMTLGFDRPLELGMGVPVPENDGMIFEHGGPNVALKRVEVAELFYKALSNVGMHKSALLIPPDYSRLQSRAGDLTQAAYRYFGSNVRSILPALGTHDPMEDWQVAKMMPGVPRNLFAAHRWREDAKIIGTIPPEIVGAVSEGIFQAPFPISVSTKVLDPSYDLILSIGQVVPHEVTGMANGVKNLLVGCGGKETIDLSHYLSALYGMDRIMGEINTPPRILLEHGFKEFLGHLPVIFALTVVSQAREDEAGDADGLVTRGLFVGRGYEVFRRAAELSQMVNITDLTEQLDHAIVYLNPHKYHTTWVGNKAIYRMRKAMKPGGEITILAPGITKFGEDAKFDSVIREHGYRSSDEIQRLVASNTSLTNNLAVTAHLIHGAPTHFKVRYCTRLDPELVRNVGYAAADYDETAKTFDPHTLRPGENIVQGQKVFFVADPGLGLWRHTSKEA